MILLAIFGLTACASSGPSTSSAATASTNNETASTQTTTQTTANKTSDVICTSERALNTRFAKKKCRTAAQVEANKAEAREVVRGGGN